MFIKFTTDERQVVQAIEENYRLHLNRLMVQHFREQTSLSITDDVLKAWMQGIRETRALCETWLETMTRSPDFYEHLGEGALSAMVRGGGSFIAKVMDGVTSFIPGKVFSRIWGSRSASDFVAKTAQDTFTSALGPFVTGLLHDAFCASFHGNPDEAEKLFSDSIEKQGNLTALIRQECEAISIELVKLFRFREMLLLGLKDPIALYPN